MKRDLLPALVVPASALVPDERNTWRRSLVALGVLVALLVTIYWDTATGIIHIWSRSETFAHGFVVPIIVAWLVFRCRASWMSRAPRPSQEWLLPISLASVAWLVGELGTVNALSQLAFTAMLICTVPLVLGNAIARQIAFPLAFLFFAVPIGEFMLPTLMQWTADFTVAALRGSGVPVYREGQEILIPTGRWSVVEACSGIRYLIASFMVGTLYAYLSFASLRRRLVFMAVALLIPIVANWVRAYMIVMIGHLSSNHLAVGVDHLIYGWLFFGFVMFLMFWVGSRWRDPEREKPPLPQPAAIPPRSPKAIGVALAAGVACIVASPIALHWVDARANVGNRVDLLPLADANAWHGRPGALVPWSPAIEGSSAVVEQTFAKEGREVGVYIAFFRNQSHTRKVASSSNALGGSGFAHAVTWAITGTNDAEAFDGARRIPVRQALLRNAGSARLVAWRWYWIDGRVTASEAMAKVYTLLARMRGHDDAAIVIVYAQSDAAGREGLQSFLRESGKALETALRRAASS
jgi:exosortase A